MAVQCAAACALCICDHGSARGVHEHVKHCRRAPGKTSRRLSQRNCELPASTRPSKAAPPAAEFWPQMSKPCEAMSQSNAADGHALAALACDIELHPEAPPSTERPPQAWPEQAARPLSLSRVYLNIAPICLRPPLLALVDGACGAHQLVFPPSPSTSSPTFVLVPKSPCNEEATCASRDINC